MRTTFRAAVSTGPPAPTAHWSTQSNKCLDANGGSTANGTQLIIWTCHGGTNQRWTLP